MTVADILASVSAMGVRLKVDGADLVATPSGALTPELRRLLSAHKPEVLVAVRKRAAADRRAHFRADPRVCAGCGRDGFVVMVVTGCGDNLCRECWTATTRVPDIRMPATPTLDRLMAEADARAERDSGGAA